MFHEAMKCADRAAPLLGVTSAADLDRRLESLDAADSALARARAFLLNPIPTLHELLTKPGVAPAGRIEVASPRPIPDFETRTGFDPLVVRILERGEDQRLAQARPRLQTMLDAAQENLQATRSLLQGMKRHWGDWHPQAATGTIAFTTPAAREVHQQATSQLALTRLRLVAAIQSWAGTPATQKATAR